MALNFDNTEVAFAYLSDEELKKSYYIFKLLNNNTLSNIGKQITIKAFDAGLPIKGIIKNTIFNAFVGGENIEESQYEIETLNRYGVGVILDYGVEAKNEESEFDEVSKTIEELMHQIKKSGNKTLQVCAKVSAFARNELLEKKSTSSYSLSEQELQEWNRVKERIHRLSKLAFELEIKLFFDAEESWMQDAIDELVTEMMAEFNQSKAIVYNTIQLYRQDRLDYLKDQHQIAKENQYLLAVKLVRGAYMEKERNRASELNYNSPIQNTKADTDSDFNSAIEYCIQHIEEISVCVASHNEESNYYLDELLHHYEISQNHVNVLSSQLFGMGDYITFNMAENGYNTLKYLPFGPVEDLLPYLVRRAQENSSVNGQASRELSLVKKELKRRGIKTLF